MTRDEALKYRQECLAKSAKIIADVSNKDITVRLGSGKETIIFIPASKNRTIYVKT
jgi:hypothetical protein